jgi:macrolide transport system ATP-binding/permease protein
MATLREWLLRLVATLHPRRHDRDLERELRSHLELAVLNEHQQGRSVDEASRAAALHTGGVAQAVEALRDQRGLPWLDDLARDVRHALRLLRRDPVFTLVAIVSLAIGIGANAAIFGLADALILRPLPVRDSGAVVTISADAPDGESGERFSYPDYRDLRDKSRSFDGVLAYEVSTLGFARSRRTSPEKRIGMLVSDNFFDVLGVQAAFGRSFTPDEAQVSGRNPVVVLGYDYWKNALGADPAILNDVVWMNGIDFHVVGIAPPDFTGVEDPLRPAFYVPLAMAARLAATPTDPLEQRDTRLVWVKGRLKSGMSKATAQAELTTLWKGLQRQYPNPNRNRTMAVRSEIQERIRQDPEDAILLVMLGALAALVLIIACANVANLMLSRIRGRSREIAIRLALGVSRGRLVRQLLTESLLLALLGFVLGLVFAYVGIRFLQTIPTADQIVIAPHLDHRVLLFGLFAAILSAAIFGVAPVRQSLNASFVPALKTSELAETTRTRIIGRSVLVVAQVALSLVLLVATGVLLDGFRKALVLDPGFRTDHLLSMSVDTSLVRYTPAQTHAFYRDLVEGARGLPGVTSATLTSAVPLNPWGNQGVETIVPEGYVFPAGQERASVPAATVDDAFFQTMHVAIIRGRAFNSGDKEESRRVAIVNEELAKRYWPNQDPVGKRMRLATSPAPIEIVGLTRTGKYFWIGEPPQPFLYLPFAQHEKPRMSMLVLTASTDPARAAGPLRDLVRTLDANQPVFDVRTLSSLYQERAITLPLMIMQMVGTMGLLGLALALIGLYGLVAYSVARRTQEIGIRMAIGASKRDVLRMVLRQGLTLSIAGIAVGGAASIVVARLLTAVLVGLGTPNPVTYVVVPLALICLTLVASYFPARRAAGGDPLVALRYD